MKIRRTEFLFFYHTDGPFLDMKYRFHPPLLTKGQVLALPILWGRELVIEQEEMQQLLEVPTTEWIKPEASSIEDNRLECFIDKGLLLSNDSKNKRALLFKSRDEILKAEKWNIYAALQHFMCRWRGVDGNLPFFFNQLADPLDNIDEQLARLPSPSTDVPSHFHRVETNQKTISLSPVKEKGALYAILNRLKTTRNFDVSKTLAANDLSQLMHYVFGCHGQINIQDKYTVLKKNNPSGGSLHSIEVYLLVLKVESIESGLYHYQVENHSLNPIKSYTLEEAKEVALRLSCRQKYAADTSALLVLTSRFYRSFWKYRKHSKMLSYHLREAAHISQNFYLVCTEMGLGCFTTSMNEVDADEEIGIDGFKEGSIMLLGCGHPKTNLSDGKYAQPDFEEYKTF